MSTTAFRLLVRFWDSKQRVLFLSWSWLCVAGCVGGGWGLTSLGSRLWIGDNPAWVLLESALGITTCGKKEKEVEWAEEEARLWLYLNEGLSQSMFAMKLKSPFRVILKSWNKDVWLLDMVCPWKAMTDIESMLKSRRDITLIWPLVRQLFSLEAVLKRGRQLKAVFY